MPREATRAVAAEAAVRRSRLSAAGIIVGIVVAACLALAIVLRFDYIAWDRGKVGLPRLLNQTEVRLSELPPLADALSRGSGQDRYAALIFGTPDRPSDEDALNIQMSVENGKLGFDWVLLGPRNIKDREQFITFARAHGLNPVAKSENGVSYLRIENTDIPKFTSSVATEMYHLPSSEPVGLVYEGFEWRRD